MKFGIEKYAMLIRKRWKRHLTEGIELSKQEKEKKRTLGEKEPFKYLEY